MKLSKQELIDLIKQEAMAIKSTMLKESAVESTVDVFDVDMNSHDGLEHSEKALTYKDKSKKVEKSGQEPSKTKMNQKDGDQGSDEDASVAVKVDAGSKRAGSNHLTGQANANFTSKKDIQDTKASGPFEDRVSKSHDIDMNKEDKLVDEKAKTYVSAGAGKGGNSHTAGQAKAEVHERMPEKDAEEPTERIAKGIIEIDGSNIALKESYTKKELKNLVLTEARKAVDSYKKKTELLREFNEICAELEKDGYDVEEMLEEGWLKNIAIKLGLKDTDEEVTKRKEKIDTHITSISQKNNNLKFYYDDNNAEVSQEDFVKKMEKNGYTGRIITGEMKDKEGNVFIKVVYKPGTYGASRLGSGGSSHGLGV